jgi:hypothetical protein
MYLDIQMVDLNTCEAAKDIALDFWHTNATVKLNALLDIGSADVILGSLRRHP